MIPGCSSFRTAPRFFLCLFFFRPLAQDRQAELGTIQEAGDAVGARQAGGYQQGAAVPVENSLLFATALKAHDINTELHIFPDGCHGLALANELTASQEMKEIAPCAEPWIDLAATWMKKYW